MTTTTRPSNFAMFVSGVFLVLLFLSLAVWATQAAGQGPTPNGSSDGRYHTCGYVTEDGVTEHLAAYWQRCGKEGS